MLEIKNLPDREMYTMFDVRFQNEGIFYFENVISYPQRLLEVIKEVDLDPRSYPAINKWEDWVASNDSSWKIGLGKKITPKNKYISTGDSLLDKKILYIINSLIMAPEMCAKNFYDGQSRYYESINKKEEIFPLPKMNFENINLYAYNEFQGMGPHVDAEDPTGTGTNLKYSFVTYLNDDYEGGELEFKNQKIRIKPKAGSLVMFPSTAPFMHESLPTTSGKKVMYTTHWIS